MFSTETNPPKENSGQAWFILDCFVEPYMVVLHNDSMALWGSKKEAEKWGAQNMQKDHMVLYYGELGVHNEKLYYI